MNVHSPAQFLDRYTPPHIVTLVLITGLAALSMNIFLPSLPAMTAYFQTDYATIQLSISAYLGVNGILQLFIGPISDRFGRRPVLLVSCLIFLIATIGCLLAPNIEVFLFFRLLQAIIVAGMVLSRAAVRDTVSADEAASMIGYVTMGMALVPMIGPVVGGLLDQWFGWQANFAMLLVLGVGISILAWADLGETHKTRSPDFLSQFRTYPELLTSRRFWGYAFAAAFSSGSFFALLGGAPFVAANHFNLGSAALGAYFAITPAGYMLGNFISGRFSTRVGINKMMLAGTLVTVAGLTASVACFLAGATHPLTLFGFTIFVGIGNGMALPNASSGMLSVRPHLAGTAAGLGGALLTGGGAAFAAVTGYLLSVEGGPYPLVYMMLAASIASVVATAYVISVARKAGELR